VDASRCELLYMPEVTWGTLPATALTPLRFVKENLKFGVQNQSSEEIRADGQVTDIVKVGQNTNGGFDFELSFGSYTDFWAALMRGAWSAPQSFSGSDISITNQGNGKFRYVDAAGANLPVVTPGEWINVGGFTNAANNGPKKVATIGTGAFIEVYDLDTMVAESAGNTVTVKFFNLVNGTTQTSFVMEKRYPDTTDTTHLLFTGMRIASCQLNFRTKDKLTGRFEFLGRSAVASGATSGTGADGVINTNRVMNASSNFSKLLIDNLPIAGTFIKELNLSIVNNMREQDAIGQIENIGVGYGRFMVSGTMQTYFENRTLYNKYIAATEMGLDLVVQDSAGNMLSWDIPSIVLTDGDVANDGNDTDIFARFSWQAKVSSLSYTMRMNRLPA
jgi:hypothetical protein